MSDDTLVVDAKVFDGLTHQAHRNGFADAISFLISIANKMKNFGVGCLPPSAAKPV